MQSRNFAWRNWPLTLKLTLTVTLVVLIAVTSVTIVSLWREQRNFRIELEQQAVLLLDTIAMVIDDSLYTQDVDFISDVMSGMGRQQLIVSGHVYDRTGRIIADAYDTSAVVSNRTDPFGQRILTSNTVIFEWQSDQLLAGKAVILGHEPVGAISVGLSTIPLTSKLDAIRLQSIGIGALTILFGILLAFLLSRSIIGPLQDLTKATQRIADGDLSYHNVITSGDELATLSLSFNTMTNRLRETLEHQEQQRQKLVDTNQELEQMLAEISRSHQIQADLTATINELSTPVLRVAHGIVLVPLIGQIDTGRAEQMMDRLLATIEHHRAQIAILDVSGVPIIDTHIAGTLLRTAQAAQLLGARVLLCGINPELAQTLVSLGLDLGSLRPAADLQAALHVALTANRTGNNADAIGLNKVVNRSSSS